MDFTRALTFPFDDQDWLKKVGLGVLIQFIPIVGTMTLQGWSYEITRRVKSNDPVPLPDWSDFGGLLGKGFLLFVGLLIYQIPTVIFGCIASFTVFLPALSGNNDSAAQTLAGVSSIVIFCCSCLIILYALAAAVVYWGGYIRFVDEPQLSTFFQIGDNFRLVRENMGDFGMVLLYVVLASVIASIVSSITVGLGSLLLTPFMMYFIGHLLGQLAAKVSPAAV